MSGSGCHLIVPGALHQRTGGYLYDARMAQELRRLGWRVTVHELTGSFPAADHRARSSLERVLSRLPERSRVVVDGLALGDLPESARTHGTRLRMVALVHHPLADETGLEPGLARRFVRREREALRHCAGVVVTSDFTASRVAEYGVPRARIRIAPPGTDRVPLARGPGPGRPAGLLCVGSVIPRKGQEVLVRALARIPRLRWRCVCVGSLTRAPVYAELVWRRVRESGLEERIELRGECDAGALRALYDASSVFVLPSYYEGYGMVLAEALARGLPIVSTTGGAIPHTVPPDAAVLVPPGDDAALAEAIRGLLSEKGSAVEEGSPAGPARRDRLAAAARRHGEALPDWERAGRGFAEAILALTPELPAAEQGFDAGWLALREPVDHRCRSHALLAPLATAWSAGGWYRILDLGTGTGSNLRYLAPRLPGPQRWILVDHDEHLLERAVVPGAVPARLRRVVADLGGLGPEAFAGVHLVTASALLDLVSEEWLARVLAMCGAGSCGVHFALTYDGTIRWGGGDPRPFRAPGGGPSGKDESGEDAAGMVDPGGIGSPEDPDDAFVRRAVNAHQRRDKGLGRALGPAAARVAERLLRAHGFRVRLRPSPWELGPEDRALAGALLEGWARAAREERPSAAARIDRWEKRKREVIAHGTFSLTVGHLDLLALPAGPREGG